MLALLVVPELSATAPGAAEGVLATTLFNRSAMGNTGDAVAASDGVVDIFVVSSAVGLATAPVPDGTVVVFTAGTSDDATGCASNTGVDGVNDTVDAISPEVIPALEAMSCAVVVAPPCAAMLAIISGVITSGVTVSTGVVGSMSVGVSGVVVSTNSSGVAGVSGATTTGVSGVVGVVGSTGSSGVTVSTGVVGSMTAGVSGVVVSTGTSGVAGVVFAGNASAKLNCIVTVSPS